MKLDLLPRGLLSALLAVAALGAMANFAAAQAETPAPGKDAVIEAGSNVPLKLVWVDGLKCWVGQYEVTQTQYEAVMAANPAMFKGPTRPIENISWNDAMEFCRRLTKSLQASGAIPPAATVTLPTEKEWESFVGNATPEDAVHERWVETGALGTAPVGSKKANQYNLYDVLGNVAEWCLNAEGQGRVLRGGSWLSHLDTLKVDYRLRHPADFKQYVCGMRVVLKEKP